MGLTSFAQTQLEREFQKFEETHVDNISDDLFLNAAFCEKYGLKSASSGSQRMKMWTSVDGDNAEKFIKVCDVRWHFKSKKEALESYHKFMDIISEGGKEITDHSIKIEGVQELRIFETGDNMRKMMEAFKITEKECYYFLFVCNGYVAKVFVNHKQGTTLEQASVFAVEAARLLNK